MNATVVLIARASLATERALAAAKSALRIARR